MSTAKPPKIDAATRAEARAAMERSWAPDAAPAAITVTANKCNRCEHTWWPRFPGSAAPKFCPACRSPYWNKPRRYEVARHARSRAKT